ncbi:phospholipase D-like domain-containing protein [Pseudarthrobacter sp. NKDBFgelt]|uniref:phospholipase D-like domain-containing protein n=1 Tax=Pseudarthrobacter sp. NKDBFgelt TaxID=3384443 RepID=UPI0038D44519
MSNSAAQGNQPLNEMRPPADYDPTDYVWTHGRRGVSTTGASITSHFGDVHSALLNFIGASEAVVGCVAWMTDFTILDQLANIETAIIVQKEDFLRPDLGIKQGWKARIRTKYAALHNEWMRYDFPAPLADMTTNSLSGIDAVRCVGTHNSEQKSATPRMHHKFLVRLRQETVEGTDFGALGKSADRVILHPEAVWTGSFNFSKNAGASFENAVEIESAEVAQSYLEEFSRVASLGEPLDWTSNWVMPEWRLGT